MSSNCLHHLEPWPSLAGARVGTAGQLPLAAVQVRLVALAVHLGGQGACGGGVGVAEAAVPMGEVVRAERVA